MVFLDPMRFPHTSAALFLILVAGCGVKTDPVPYLDTVARPSPAPSAEPNKNEPAKKNQAPK